MKLVINEKENAEKFNNIITNLQRFCENVILFFHKDHFYVQGMDFTQVALFEVKLDAEFFSEYTVDDGDTSSIGVKSLIIQKLFNTRNTDQNITISYTGNPDKINVSFENVKEDSLDIPKYFELPLIEIDTPLLSIPDSEYPVDFSISTKVFCGLITDLLLFGDSIKVKCDEDNISMETNNFEGSIKLQLYKSEDVVGKISDYAIEEDYSLELDFNNKYFTHFCGFSKLSSMIYLYFSDTMPMQMKYEISDNSYVRFYLTSLSED